MCAVLLLLQIVTALLAHRNQDSIFVCPDSAIKFLATAANTRSVPLSCACLVHKRSLSDSLLVVSDGGWFLFLIIAHSSVVVGPKRFPPLSAPSHAHHLSLHRESFLSRLPEADHALLDLPREQRFTVRW